MTSSWSQIPPEIAHEIAGHNANDVPTLRAMSLVSKFTRSLAIIHLFSFIHFACVEDFSRWLTMLDRTPTLGTIVKRVKFSDEVGQSWLRRHRGLEAATRLRHSAVPPIIPPLPSVRCVAWDDVHFVTNSTMVAYMALFPNVEKLHLRNKSFSALAQLINLLGACGRLRSLSFETTTVEEVESGSEMEFEAPADSDTPDLTALEELVVKDCSYPEEVDYLAHLIEDCPPNGLKTLTFGGIFRDEPCSVHATEKLLRLGALSLANLMLDPSFPYTGRRNALDMLSRLPVLMSLESLTIWLSPNRDAEHVINALKGAPNLTKLIFRIVLYKENDEDDREEFNKILTEVLPWGTPEPMKTAVMRKFPLCQYIGFHFCIPGDSDMHFRRGLRRRMERRLKDRLDETGAQVADYLHVEWLDKDLHPVTYNKTNGKPPWNVPRSFHYPEPQTEASDCESEKSDNDSDEYDSDGNPVIRVWTEEHERAYRREMLMECGIYSDGEPDW